jgi:rhodanese-related sulfurtransferase
MMSADTSDDIARVDVAELQGLLGKPGIQVIDVRAPFDYFGGRVPGAMNLPGVSAVDRAGQLKRLTQVIFVCDDGSVSEETARAVRAAGVENVAVVDGGFDAWTDADYPTETISDGAAPPAGA